MIWIIPLKDDGIDWILFLWIPPKDTVFNELFNEE